MLDLALVVLPRRGLGRPAQQGGQVLLVDVPASHVGHRRIGVPEILVILAGPAVVHSSETGRSFQPSPDLLHPNDLDRALQAAATAPDKHHEVDPRRDLATGGHPREAVHQVPGCQLAERHLGRGRGDHEQAALARATHGSQDLRLLEREHVADHKASGHLSQRTLNGLPTRSRRVDPA